jgi:ATP/maltotriose-dependent transcriptional regulator MalT
LPGKCLHRNHQVFGSQMGTKANNPRLYRQDESQRRRRRRELEIIQLLAEGLAKREIASRLDIGYCTVHTHVAHIYEKLKVSNAPSAVNRAHRLGLSPPDE